MAALSRKKTYTSPLVQRCARCGKNHRNLTFKKLRRPLAESTGLLLTHWAPCPTNGDPILMHFTED